MARAAAPASGAPAMWRRRPASPATPSLPSPASGGGLGWGWADGATDFVHDSRVALHENLWPDARAIGDGFGRAARMAAKNPRATFKTPITVEDVLNSRMIAYPFRLLQCCLVTDGGGALILVSAERARDFPQKPVYLLGTGESVETPMVSQMADFTSSRAFRVAGA